MWWKTSQPAHPRLSCNHVMHQRHPPQAPLCPRSILLTANSILQGGSTRIRAIRQMLDTITQPVSSERGHGSRKAQRSCMHLFSGICRRWELPSLTLQYHPLSKVVEEGHKQTGRPTTVVRNKAVSYLRFKCRCGTERTSRRQPENNLAMACVESTCTANLPWKPRCIAEAVLRLHFLCRAYVLPLRDIGAGVLAWTVQVRTPSETRGTPVLTRVQTRDSRGSHMNRNAATCCSACTWYSHSTSVSS